MTAVLSHLSMSVSGGQRAHVQALSTIVRKSEEMQKACKEGAFDLQQSRRSFLASCQVSGEYSQTHVRPQTHLFTRCHPWRTSALLHDCVCCFGKISANGPDTY